MPPSRKQAQQQDAVIAVLPLVNKERKLEKKDMTRMDPHARTLVRQLDRLELDQGILYKVAHDKAGEHLRQEAAKQKLRHNKGVKHWKP